MAQLEIRGPAQALVDEPLDFDVRGGGEQPAHWRARFRDDDEKVWRADGPSPLQLGAWTAKQSEARVALASLHPLRLDMRVDVEDGRGASRTFTRQFLADGVRMRRCRTQGLAVETLSQYALGPVSPGLVLGYGRLHLSAIPRAVRALAAVVLQQG